ncbi:MAG: L-fucose/L-arabinose isomerase family protein [bacterium]|nr:L-fucose/L-arabinose isomerase family protein [bacterium]
MKTTFKLGLAPTRRNVFSREDSQKYKKLVETRLTDMGIEFVNIDGINEEGLLFSAADARAALDKFRREGVDAVMVPHCNFGTEDAVARLGRDLGKPLLLWGPRDEAPLSDGTRLRDTQCGLFATGKILRRMGVPFSYITNCRMDDPVLERGIRVFVQAARAANAFKGARIGQASTRPGDFWTMMINEGELLERWGIEVVPTTMADLELGIERVLKDRSGEVREEIADISSRVSISRVPGYQMEKIAALKLSLIDWVKEQELDALGIQCWTAMQEKIGIYPCFVNGELTEAGIPVTCETDIHGAITSIMLQAAAGAGTSPIFFADLTIRHPEDDNAELLWHCGPFPVSLAAEGEKPEIQNHFIHNSVACGCNNWRIKGGRITVARFDGDNGQYSLLAGHADGTDGPATQGTYLWVKVNDWPLWEDRLVRGPYVHHVACIHGEYTAALREAVRFIPGLKFDGVDPTESEIDAWLRG